MANHHGAGGFGHFLGTGTGMNQNGAIGGMMGGGMGLVSQQVYVQQSSTVTTADMRPHTEAVVVGNSAALNSQAFCRFPCQFGSNQSQISSMASSSGPFLLKTGDNSDAMTKCLICSCVLTRSQMPVHVSHHLDYKPYICLLCGQRYPDFDFIQAHCLEKGHLPVQYQKDEDHVLQQLSDILSEYFNILGRPVDPRGSYGGGVESVVKNLEQQIVQICSNDQSHNGRCRSIPCIAQLLSQSFIRNRASLQPTASCGAAGPTANSLIPIPSSDIQASTAGMITMASSSFQGADGSAPSTSVPCQLPEVGGIKSKAVPNRDECGEEFSSLTSPSGANSMTMKTEQFRTVSSQPDPDLGTRTNLRDNAVDDLDNQEKRRSPETLFEKYWHPSTSAVRNDSVFKRSGLNDISWKKLLTGCKERLVPEYEAKKADNPCCSICGIVVGESENPHRIFLHVADHVTRRKRMSMFTCEKCRFGSNDSMEMASHISGHVKRNEGLPKISQNGEKIFPELERMWRKAFPDSRVQPVSKMVQPINFGELVEEFLDGAADGQIVRPEDSCSPTSASSTPPISIVSVQGGRNSPSDEDSINPEDSPSDTSTQDEPQLLPKTQIAAPKDRVKCGMCATDLKVVVSSLVITTKWKSLIFHTLSHASRELNLRLFECTSSECDFGSNFSSNMAKHAAKHVFNEEVPLAKSFCFNLEELWPHFKRFWRLCWPGKALTSDIWEALHGNADLSSLVDTVLKSCAQANDYIEKGSHRSRQAAKFDPKSSSSNSPKKLLASSSMPCKPNWQSRRSRDLKSVTGAKLISSPKLKQRSTPRHQIGLKEVKSLITSSPSFLGRTRRQASASPQSRNSSPRSTASQRMSSPSTPARACQSTSYAAVAKTIPSTVTNLDEEETSNCDTKGFVCQLCDKETMHPGKHVWLHVHYEVPLFTCAKCKFSTWQILTVKNHCFLKHRAKRSSLARTPTVFFKDNRSRAGKVFANQAVLCFPSMGDKLLPTGKFVRRSVADDQKPRKEHTSGQLKSQPGTSTVNASYPSHALSSPKVGAPRKFCQLCDKVIDGTLANHVAVHVHEKIRLFQCKICANSYPLYCSMSDHIRHEHNIQCLMKVRNYIVDASGAPDAKEWFKLLRNQCFGQTEDLTDVSLFPKTDGHRPKTRKRSPSPRGISSPKRPRMSEGRKGSNYDSVRKLSRRSSVRALSKSRKTSGDDVDVSGPRRKCSEKAPRCKGGDKPIKTKCFAKFKGGERFMLNSKSSPSVWYCNICRQGITNRSTKGHVKSLHFKCYYSCPYCVMSFKRYHRFRLHSQKKHPAKEIPQITLATLDPKRKEEFLRMMKKCFGAAKNDLAEASVDDATLASRAEEQGAELGTRTSPKDDSRKPVLRNNNNRRSVDTVYGLHCRKCGILVQRVSVHVYFHLSQEWKNRQVSCRECGRQFVTFAMLKRHFKMDHKEQWTLKTVQKLPIVARAYSEMEFQCFGKSIYSLELTSSTKEVLVKPDSEGSSGITDDDSSGIRMSVACHLCKQVTALLDRDAHVWDHVSKENSGVEPRRSRISCEICEAGFSSEQYVYDHYRLVHAERQRMTFYVETDSQEVQHRFEDMMAKCFPPDNSLCSSANIASLDIITIDDEDEMSDSLMEQDDSKNASKSYKSERSSGGLLKSGRPTRDRHGSNDHRRSSGSTKNDDDESISDLADLLPDLSWYELQSKPDEPGGFDVSAAVLSMPTLELYNEGHAGASTAAMSTDTPSSPMMTLNDIITKVEVFDADEPGTSGHGIGSEGI